MFRFSYMTAGGVKIRFAAKDRNIFLNKLMELASLAFRGKIYDIKFY